MRRKLTTIVAADVVGYSRLLSEDESGMLEALDILRNQFIAPKAKAYSGRIFRFLGDGTLLEFDSACGAVEFAIDLLRSLAEHNAANLHRVPIHLRTGINLGDVIFEGEDIHGEGVNIAVRLEAMAEPGGLCLTESVYAQIKNRMASNFIAIGPRRLRNIVDPVEVWRWRASTDASAPVVIDALKSEVTALNGHQMIDPKLIDLVLKLHARSVLLAISDALDAIVDDTTDEAKVEQLYFHISDQLQHARALLGVVKIERVDDFRELTTSSSKFQTLSEFVFAMFNDSKVGFAFKILPEIHQLLSGDQSFIIKRKRLMEIVRRFHNEEFIAQSLNQIKFAYVA